MPIDFSSLPAPEIIEPLDFEAIITAMVADLQERAPEYTEILESDPGVKIMEVCAARELALRGRINDALRNTLVRYAGGGDLDNLAAFYGVTRLAGETDEALRLRTILAVEGRSCAGGAAWYRFHALSADPRVKDVYVAATAPGEVQVAVLSAEAEQVELAAGEDLDALGVPFGIVRQGSESDGDYRERILAQIIAGGGYGVASQDLVDTVDEALQADDIRVVTDHLTTVGATITTIDVVADVYLYPQTPSTVFDGLESELRASFDAVSGMGWDVTRSWLTAALHPAGVQRVALSSPVADVEIAPDEAPVLGTVTLTMAGRTR